MATNNQKSPMPHIIPGIISFIMDHLHRLAGNAFRTTAITANVSTLIGNGCSLEKRRHYGGCEPRAWIVLWRGYAICGPPGLTRPIALVRNRRTRVRRCRHRHQRPDHPLLYCVARFAWPRSHVIANHKKTSPRKTNRGSRTRSICVFEGRRSNGSTLYRHLRRSPCQRARPRRTSLTSFACSTIETTSEKRPRVRLPRVVQPAQ
jgi:hypothetical protein